MNKTIPIFYEPYYQDADCFIIDGWLKRCACYEDDDEERELWLNSPTYIKCDSTDSIQNFKEIFNANVDEYLPHRAAIYYYIKN